MSPPNAYTASFSSFTLQHILFSAQQFNSLKLFIYLLTFSLIYWLSSPPCCKLNDCQELFCPVTWSPELRAIYSQHARVLCSVAPVTPSLLGHYGLWPARPSVHGILQARVLWKQIIFVDSFSEQQQKMIMFGIKSFRNVPQEGKMLWWKKGVS